MADREIGLLKARLAAIEASARKIASQLEDLHGVAYERVTTGNAKVSGGAAGGVETSGDERARELWRVLTETIEPMELRARALQWAVGNLLSRGGSAEEFVGDPLIPRREFRDALRQQHRRRERGEYVPVAVIDQPEYPGTAGGR